MRLDRSMRVHINERNLAMFTASRLAKSSLLILLTATLTTAAYARGSGHSGSNGSTGPSAPVHGSAVQTNARIVAGNGNKTLPKGAAYWCGPHHHNCTNTYIVHPPVAPQGAAK
jgi:hypothetical protein